MADAPKTQQKRDLSSLVRMLPRLLIVAAIWGIAVFLWGTFGAWTREQFTETEHRLASRKAATLNAWLENAVSPLDRLAADKRLMAATTLPTGVESLPVQRVLYEYSYLTHQTELYIVDLLRKRVGRTAGTAPLSADTLERLGDLPDAERMVLGMGLRNGQIFLIRKVDAPLPNRMVVMLPVSLLTLGSTQPPMPMPQERLMALVVPHTTGWGLWEAGNQGFKLSQELNDGMKARDDIVELADRQTILTDLKPWPGVRMAVSSPNKITGPHLLPQFLVGLWAVIMTVVVMWGSSEGLRKTVGTSKLAKPLKGAGDKIRAMFGGLSAAISGRLRRTEEAPLVDGPGEFGRQDFVSVEELGARMKPRKVPVIQRNLRLNEPKANLNFSMEGDRRKMDRRKAVRKGTTDRRAQMGSPEHALKVWQKAAGIKEPLLPKAVEPKPVEMFDKNNIRAVVEEALKSRRVKLLYQPIYRSNDNMPVMHEVYARLVRSDGHILTPDVFLPVAVEHKLTLQLDLLVLRKVVQEHFSQGAPLTPLALNISSTSLDGLAYLQEMAALGPRVLQKMSFEVSSQEMIRDPKALKLLKDVQKHGGNLSVDYFGGGAAMLDASKSMGFNYVKLNAMRMSSTDAGKKDIITLCQYAKTIGLPTVVEMVGDAATETFARRAGAEFLQGYALGRPSDYLTIEPITPSVSSIGSVANNGS